MNTMTMVRIYLTEAEKQLETVIHYLHDEVKGATVFRGISGFGDSGKLHTTNLLDLSFNLPLVVEFFDKPTRITQVLAGLQHMVKSDHIITWPVNLSA